jgi:hypothetical protein
MYERMIRLNTKHSSSSISSYKYFPPSWSLTAILFLQLQHAEFCAPCFAVALSRLLIRNLVGCNVKTDIQFHEQRAMNWQIKLVHEFKEEKVSNTVFVESMSGSLCFISLAIEKKASLTFRFVFALCDRKSSVCNNRKKTQGCFNIFKYTLLTVSKNLIPYSFASALPLGKGTT